MDTSDEIQRLGWRLPVAVGLFLTAIACPIVGTAILQGSVVRGFWPGLWAALSVRYGTGGKTIGDGIPKGTYQSKLALRGQRVAAGAVTSDNDVFDLHGASRVFTRCGDPDPEWEPPGVKRDK